MDIRLDQILFQIVNFGVVVGLLTYYLYKPVMKLLEERSQKVLLAEKAAQQSIEEKEQMDVLKQKTKIQVEKEAAQLLEKAKVQAQELKRGLTQQAKEEVKVEREKTMKSLELEKKGYQADLEREMAAAVYAVTEKVLGKAIDKKQHAELIDKSLKEIAALV